MEMDLYLWPVLLGIFSGSIIAVITQPKLEMKIIRMIRIEMLNRKDTKKWRWICTC